MTCSKQKQLDAHFNTSAAERRMNEEPETKKYRPTSCKYNPAYIKFVSYVTMVAHQSLLCDLPDGSQQWSSETLKNAQTFDISRINSEDFS